MTATRQPPDLPVCPFLAERRRLAELLPIGPYPVQFGACLACPGRALYWQTGRGIWSACPRCGVAVGPVAPPPQETARSR